MRVLVTGGRYYRDRAAVFITLDEIEASSLTKIEIIEGGQRSELAGKVIGGADYWANCWARSRGRRCHTYFADWESNPRSAGPIRNSEMLSDGKPHIVVAFPGGGGTADMVRKARAAGFEVKEVKS